MFAQLVVDGESHGVHCVLVPIRDDAGAPAPGVTIEDCGPKLGLDGVDNGRLLFDHVRVPRPNLLGRYGDIDDDGTYSSPIDNPGRRFFTMLGTLVRGRISVAGGAGAAARSALAVTTRYAGGRRQFAAPGSDVETTVLDYRTYQRRLLPRIATAYALQLAQHELVGAMDDVLAGRTTSEQDQRQLETRAAGIKVLTTRHATDTIQECRELCGGAGYLWANRLGALKADTDIFTTFEGDNTVLLQLVAKSLLTEYQATFGDLDTAGIVRFGARLVGGTVIERSSARGIIQRLVDAAPGREEDVIFGIRGTQLRLLREREEHLIEGLARRLRRATAPGADAFAVFNATQDHLVDAGAAHVERVVAESFAASVESCTDEDARAVLSRVCDLHVLSTIERHKAWYLEHDRLSPARAKALTALVNERVHGAATARTDARRRLRHPGGPAHDGDVGSGGRALVATAAVDQGRLVDADLDVLDLGLDEHRPADVVVARRVQTHAHPGRCRHRARSPGGLFPLGEPERSTRGRHGAGEDVREPLVTRPEQGDDRCPGLHELVEQVRVGVQETHDPAGLARGHDVGRDREACPLDALARGPQRDGAADATAEASHLVAVALWCVERVLGVDRHGTILHDIICAAAPFTPPRRRGEHRRPRPRPARRPGRTRRHTATASA